MCAKILKKESSSRALAFFMLLFMTPLAFINNTQSCRAMEVVDTENDPLLGSGSGNRDVRIPINGDGGDMEERVPVSISRKKITPVQVDRNLLSPLNSTEANRSKNDIEQYLYYADLVNAITKYKGKIAKIKEEIAKIKEALSKEGLEKIPVLEKEVLEKEETLLENEEALEELFQEEKLKKTCDNKDKLGVKLLAKARDALDENSPFLIYLIEIKENNGLLIEKAKEFRQNVQDYQQLVQDYQQEGQTKEAEIVKLKKQDRLSQTSLCRMKWILWASVPTATVLGGLVGVLFTHFFWRTT